MNADKTDPHHKDTKNFEFRISNFEYSCGTDLPEIRTNFELHNSSCLCDFVVRM
jgi:hypothetical protein